MSDDDRERAQLLIDLGQRLQNHDSCLDIQRAGRFVTQQDIRPFDDRPRNGHPLLFTAGQLHRVVVLSGIQAHQFQSGIRVQGLLGNVADQSHVLAQESPAIRL